MALPKIFKNIDARVKKAGDTMFGDLLIKEDASCNIIMTCNNSGRQSAFSSTGDGFTCLYNENPNDASNNRVALWLGSEDVENNRLFRINRKVNGVSETFQVYGEHFKPTPADIGALALSGGELTGLLSLAPNIFNDTPNTGALNCNNSNIYGVNAIYMSQDTSTYNEGINFYNSDGSLDSLYGGEGILNYMIKRPYDGSSTTIRTIANLEENIMTKSKDLILSTYNFTFGNSDYDISTWKINAPKIILRPENGGAQDVYLIPTQYDNVYSKAGLVIAGPQGGEYLWSLGPLITSNKVVFHKRYEITGAPKAAGAINGDRVLEYIHNPNGEIDTSPILTVYAPADVNGICPVLGGGGATIVSAGESYSSFPNTGMIEDGFAVNNEHLFLTADGAIHMYVNCNSIANRKRVSITAAGALVVPTATDYTTFKARNIAAGTASASITNNGDMYVKY